MRIPGSAVILSLSLLVAIGPPIIGPANAAEPPDPEGIRYFETHIRPLLDKHCYACHSFLYSESELELDSFKGMLEGGKAGPALVPGKPKKSLILTAVSYDDATLQMPPEEKLSKEQVARLTAWIKMGAPYPGATAMAPRESPEIDLAEEREFWSFQPISDPPPPAVKKTAWPRDELDRFILARLEAEGLTPAPPADKRILIRRATFDLTGLPPTVAEIDAFLADDSPDAYKTVINRLLASPAYGERWGRHWLDVARYADSNGLDENVAYGNAWRYRDYVVDAFNNDKPYNEFVMEQLAGDLLPADGRAERHEQLTATGFLVLGPKLLAEPDKKKMEMDIIDEQIDTVGRAFMGLTLGCARCHDHKFDPILTADYYALAGIFKSTLTMDSLKTVGKWHENPIPSPADLKKKAEHEEKVAHQQQEIDEVIEKANAELVAMLETGATLPEKPQKELEAKYPAETKAELKKLRDKLAALKKAAPVMPSAMGVAEAEPVDVAIHIRGSHLTLGEVVPRRFPLVIAGTEQPPLPDDASGRLKLAKWIASPEHPLTARVMVNRIWHWHFGKGLVTTTDNFGLQGDRPSHPQLLDWLASRFIKNGWSIKDLHRDIMLSSTYRMSNAYNAKAAKVDPENELLWRFEMRRMEAEEIRDSLLAVSGQLDLTIGGNLLDVGNREYIFNHTSMDHTTYDATRRSIYVPVVRNHLYAPFALFDYSDASVVVGDRPTSTVAPQALFMMNSELVIKAADLIAKSLLADTTADDGQRIVRLYERALGRPAEPKEVAQAKAFLDRFASVYTRNKAGKKEPRRASWSALCQMVLASNEFIYIR